MDNKEKNDCAVCCEKIRHSVLCQCNFEVCRNCVRTYLAGQISEPHCMNCKVAWNMEFLENAIGKTYLKNDYKKQRVIVFSEFEKTQLPNMQEDARIYEITDRLTTEIKELNKKNGNYRHGTFGCNWCIGNKYKMFIGCEPCKTADTDKRTIQMENVRIRNLTKDPEKIRELINKFEKSHYNTYRYTHCDNFRFKCLNCYEKFPHEILYGIIKNEINKPFITCQECEAVSCIDCFEEYSETHECKNIQCNCSMYECDTCIYNQNEETVYSLKEQINTINKKGGQIKERKIFIMKCQVNDCGGFLSQQYKCGLCTKFTCSACYMPKDENHICNPDDVASTKMIKDETRPCPKCSTRIYKIDGCDQMWCTDCKTAFSWKTGTIVNGNVHNPHYYEYLRNTEGSVPRADEPYNPCGDILDEYQIRAFRQKFMIHLNKSPKISGWIDHHISVMHRYLGEINDVVETTNIEVNDMNGDRYVRNLKHNRILFLLKRIDKERFETNAFMYHQRSIQFRRFLELTQMLKQVVLDIFNKMHSGILEEAKNKNKIDANKVIDLIIECYKELFGVIRYFKSQHTNNPYTKIVSDHYDTGFTIVNGKKRELSFTVPEVLELKDEVPLFHLSFTHYSDEEKSGKKSKNVKKHNLNADY
jgi:hypothetical protein